MVSVLLTIMAIIGIILFMLLFNPFMINEIKKLFGDDDED